MKEFCVRIPFSVVALIIVSLNDPVLGLKSLYLDPTRQILKTSGVTSVLVSARYQVPLLG